MTTGHVLIADDDDSLRSLVERVVVSEGFEAHSVADGDAAVQAFREGTFDMVLSDIDMPGRNGIALLEAIRATDLDVPVILITGAPRLETAIAAVENGATRYLTKPVDVAALRTAIRKGMQARHFARARRELVAATDRTSALQVGDLAGLAARFDQALASAHMVCQPIVRWSTRSIFAYEALVRSAEPTIPYPDSLFDAGDRLDRTRDIGRTVRGLCAELHAGLPDAMLFVNLHPIDLLDEALYAADAPLARVAQDVILEVTERARVEDVPDLPARMARLRELGFRIAIDDLGAGYAGLTSFAALEPEFMKLDRALVTGLDTSPTQRRLVGAMLEACIDLNVHVIGEGVETAGERDALVDLGCDLLQGYLFAKPSPPFVEASF